MNPDPLSLFDPQTTTPNAATPRSLTTILSALACGLIGTLLFVAGVLAATQVVGIWYDRNPSHDRDVTGMFVCSIIVLFLCPLGFVLVRRAWQIWHLRKTSPS